MVEAVRDLIEESRKRAKSNYTPAKERAKWTKVAGQLIWYKDQILRSMSYEALAEDVAKLKEEVRKNFPDPSKTVLRRTIKDRTGKVLHVRMTRVNTGNGKGPQKRRTRASMH